MKYKENLLVNYHWKIRNIWNIWKNYPNSQNFLMTKLATLPTSMASALSPELKANIDWIVGQQKQFSLEVQQWIGEHLSDSQTLIQFPAFSSPQGFYDEIVRRIQKGL
jgi:hypothetical protein